MFRISLTLLVHLHLLLLCFCRDLSFWRIDLPSNIEPGKTMTVDVESSYAHALTPYPAEITQSQKQQVLYEGNVFFFTPYSTKSQTTTVTTTNTAIESYSKSPKPVSQTDRTVTYGPYEQREAFAEVKNCLNQNLSFYQISLWISKMYACSVFLLNANLFAGWIESTLWKQLSFPDSY